MRAHASFTIPSNIKNVKSITFNDDNETCVLYADENRISTIIHHGLITTKCAYDDKSRLIESFDYKMNTSIRYSYQGESDYDLCAVDYSNVHISWKPENKSMGTIITVRIGDKSTSFVIHSEIEIPITDDIMVHVC